MQLFATGPLRVPFDLANYLAGKFFSVLFPLVSSRTKGHGVGRFGHITFSGERQFVDDCLAALNDELPKHDPALHKHFAGGAVRLGFYDQNTESDKLGKKIYSTCRFQQSQDTKKPVYVSFFAAGYFGIHQQIWRHGPVGICQFIVFRYFQTLELGTGFSAAIRYGKTDWRRASFTRAMDHMIKWLGDVDYPEKWTDGYKALRNPAGPVPQPSNE